VKTTIERYQTIICSSADNGYVIGVFNQKTGECQQDDEGFDEVAELNRLHEENRQLKRDARRMARDLKALTKLALHYQKRALAGPSFLEGK
jgi:hypothetical protein